LRGKEEAEHRLFAFLTTQANDLVRPVHAKAMPVVLAEADWETWLTASREVALDLQTAPAPAGLQIVATGARKDG
jgi:putative SOS response-associated peptidase YedK